MPRPRKYATEEERHEAVRESHRKYREANREAIKARLAKRDRSKREAIKAGQKESEAPSTETGAGKETGQ